MGDSRQISEDTDRSGDDLTQVVSYLDGELDDHAVVAVEQRLADDEDLRRDADALARTWAMLDELEEVSADKTFTQQTLSTIRTETQSTKKRKRFRVGTLLTLLATYKVVPCFLLGLLGGITGVLFSSRSDRQDAGMTEIHQVNQTLLQEFELLRNASMYSAVPDAAQLRALPFPLDDTSTQPDEVSGE